MLGALGLGFGFRVYRGLGCSLAIARAVFHQPLSVKLRMYLPLFPKIRGTILEAPMIRILIYWHMGVHFRVPLCRVTTI